LNDIEDALKEYRSAQLKEKHKEKESPEDDSQMKLF